MKHIAMVASFNVNRRLTREELDQQSDAIADALVDMEETHSGLLDSSVSVDFGEYTVEISVTVAHEGLEEGRALAHSCVNRAIHVADSGSEGAEQELAPTKESSELVPA